MQKTLVIIGLLAALVFAAGCAAPGNPTATAIKSAADVTTTVDSVGTGIDRVSGILSDLDNELGGSP